jgi:hypothetical protein
VQYTYRILGTPKTVGFVDFDALPLAALYGKTIVVSCLRIVGSRCCVCCVCITSGGVCDSQTLRTLFGVLCVRPCSSG